MDTCLKSVADAIERNYQNIQKNLTKRIHDWIIEFGNGVLFYLQLSNRDHILAKRYFRSCQTANRNTMTTSAI